MEKSIIIIRTRDRKIYEIESTKEFIGKILPDIEPPLLPALIQLLRGPVTKEKDYLIIKNKTEDLPKEVDSEEYEVKD